VCFHDGDGKCDERNAIMDSARFEIGMGLPDWGYYASLRARRLHPRRCDQAQSLLELGGFDVAISRIRKTTQLACWLAGYVLLQIRGFQRYGQSGMTPAVPQMRLEQPARQHVRHFVLRLLFWHR
jgi:hypothetical protein